MIYSKEIKIDIERLKHERGTKILELYAKMQQLAKNSIDMQRGMNELNLLLQNINQGTNKRK